MAHATTTNPFLEKSKMKVSDELMEIVSYIARRMRETGKGVTLQEIAWNFGYSNRD